VTVVHRILIAGNQHVHAVVSAVHLNKNQNPVVAAVGGSLLKYALRRQGPNRNPAQHKGSTRSGNAGVFDEGSPVHG
jgi:hypothetical protein